MGSYSLTLLIRNDLVEKKRQELLDEVKGKMISDKGKITKEDLWGAKDLAYSIKHQTKAYYAHFELETDPSVISSLDKMVKLNEDIIRYLLVRK